VKNKSTSKEEDQSTSFQNILRTLSPTFLERKQCQYTGVLSTQNMEFFGPPSTTDMDEDPIMKEFISILEELPNFIQSSLEHNYIAEKYEQHCWSVPDESERTLVMIDGGKFEFYLFARGNKVDTNEFQLPIDLVILEPFFQHWNSKNGNMFFKNAPPF
jgi:hypothetical protein